MAAKQGAGKGSKGRKYGRNSLKCARYRAEGRREKNKARRAAKLQKHLLKAKIRREKKGR